LSTVLLATQYVIAVGNAGSLLLTGAGNKWGFPVLITAQVVFIWYTLVTGQPGFLVHNVIMIIIATQAFWRWDRLGPPMIPRSVT